MGIDYGPFDRPLMVGYGCGVDSTALLLGLYERDVIPDAILFADTGGEKPETYHFLFRFDTWLSEHGFPFLFNEWIRPPGYEEPSFRLPERRVMRCIQVVRPAATLEQRCLDNKMLPSIAYGRRACSERTKQRPQHQWTKHWKPAMDRWAGGDLVTKLLGYDADEWHRTDNATSDGYYRYRYPLVEWGWTRKDCAAAIARAGLPVPIKSACFFCPSSKKQEIFQLQQLHPTLLKRALDMEQNAQENLRTVKGLGRGWSWGSLIRRDAAQLKLFPDTYDTPCLCQTQIYEGEFCDSEIEPPELRPEDEPERPATEGERNAKTSKTHR
jgi:hypothetical protein